MAAISYSAFLQALGWAALNSIWQTGLLWCIFLTANYFVRLSPQKKYGFSVVSITASLLLFFGNITYYLLNGSSLQLNFINPSLTSASGWLPAILTSASIAYLFLLIIPTYQLFVNWRFIKILQQHGLQKTNIESKLFVQKMSRLLGIKKEVSVHLSELIKSPVTIGYLKPIILLPVAFLNNLNMQQAEAVLLHELSHIRRYDYLINIFISIVHTVLYFNPFVKLFVRTAEASREESCDQMVLQFGYDKISYASALLNLERSSAQTHIFAIGATGKSHFLQRIEKIVGLSSKGPVFNFTHIAGFFVALLCAFTIQVFFATKQQTEGKKLFAYSNFANPFYFLVSEEKAEDVKPRSRPSHNSPLNNKVVHHPNKETKIIEQVIIVENEFQKDIIPVSLNEVEASLTADEKKQVKSTVRLAKKVLYTYEWNKLKESIPDGLSKDETEIAHLEYINEVNKLNWKNLEENLKADYKNINWDKINLTFEIALKQEQLDSAQNNLEQAIKIIKTAEQNHQVNLLPFPDESIQTIQIMKQDLCKKLDSIQNMRKKIVRL